MHAFVILGLSLAVAASPALARLAAAAEPSASAAAPMQPAPIVVDVFAQSAGGRSDFGAGAAVRLEVSKFSQMDGEVSLENVWFAVADEKGHVVFEGVPEPSPGRQLRAVARWQGFEWSADIADRVRPTTISAYAVTADRSSLRAQLGFTVILSEEDIVVDQGMHITTGDDPRAVDVERGEGLRLPMLIHAVFDQPLDGAWMPPRPNPETTRFELEPPADRLGRLVVERGTMVYRGIIPPGGIVITAQYPVPYVEETKHTLAFSSPVALEGLQFTVPLMTGMAPEIALRRPFQMVTRSMAEGERRLIVPTRLPEIGEAVFLDIQDSPSRLAMMRPVTVALATALVIILALVFMRTRRT